MASLKSFRTDTRAVNDGAWIEVGSGVDAFRIRTRGFTAAYRDRLHALRLEAARILNRNVKPGAPSFSPSDLPPSVDDACQGRALAEEAFIDVDGLTHEPDAGGAAVSAAEYREMLMQPAEYAAIIALTLHAAARVHAEREQDAQAAAGN